MGLEALQISTCYKIWPEFWWYLGLEASLFIVEISTGLYTCYELHPDACCLPLLQLQPGPEPEMK